MRNRAKCKLCNDIIESIDRHNFVTCKCGEISVDGGEDRFRLLAKNWENFLRIDDEGNEIPIKIEDPENGNEKDLKPSINRKDELLNELDRMIKSLEELPPLAMTTSVTHYDLCAALILIHAIIKD